MSPENLNNEAKVDCAVADMFSVGVIMALLLERVHPYERFGDTVMDVIKRISVGDVRKGVREGGHLVMRLLEADPKRRITARQALDHVWFKVK